MWLTVSRLAALYRLSEIEVSELLEKYSLKVPGEMRATDAAVRERFAKKTDAGYRWHWYRADEMIFRRQKPLKLAAVALLTAPPKTFEQRWREYAAARRLVPEDEWTYIATRAATASHLSRAFVAEALEAHNYEEFLDILDKHIENGGTAPHDKR